MTIQVPKLMHLLKTFPPDNAARFYCSINKTYYYYIAAVSSGLSIIRIYVSSSSKYSPSTYRQLISKLRGFSQLELFDPDSRTHFELR